LTPWSTKPTIRRQPGCESTIPDDREPEADAQHRDAEEERCHRRNDQQDQEQEKQSPSAGPNDGKPSEEGEEGDTVGSEPEYSPDDLTVPDIPLEDEAGAESVTPVATIPAIEQASRDIVVPELSLHGIDVETTSVNIATDAPDIAVEGKEWQFHLT